MNILSITTILPIPEIVQTNDFLIPLYTAYRNKYPKDNVTFIKPTSFKPFSKLNKQLNGLRSYELHGFNVTLLPYFSTWRYANIHSMIASYTSFYFNRRRILRYLKDHAIDVIHAENIIPDGYLAYIISKKCNIPYVITSHNELRYFNSVLSKKMALKVLNNAFFVTPLNYTAMEIYKKYKVDNTLIVPHGIEESFLQTIPKFNNTGEIRILSIGALIALKNLDKVLYALANLKNKYAFRYTIVGSGPEKNALVSLTRKLNLTQRVDFLEIVPYRNIPAEMGKNDIFILPSYFESFGRVFFEAMAVGLPIICAKNTGVHGYFIEGEAGFSVIHYDVADIENKLSLLLSNAELRKEMGQKAKKLMYNYTWDKIVVTFHDLYERSIYSKSHV
jgi:glycosyltransferase involved in cell wall biosynthesis